MSQPIRTAVIGAGAFGRNHLRVLSQLPESQLVAVVDTDPARRDAAAQQYGCAAYADVAEIPGGAEAAVVAVPTQFHAAVASQLLQAGVDVLVEKPLTATIAEADELVALAEQHGRILQVGHLERFNPAVAALQSAITTPLFFEIHRMSLFSPRSLDVDVILDLMIHDLDLVLSMTGQEPEDIRAAGIRILSNKVDIAHVRLAFANGCVANLTASRASTEKVRKLRLFQPHEYLSLDYEKQQLVGFRVDPGQQIGFNPFDVPRAEPLQRELAAFLASVRTRETPLVDGRAGLRVLRLAHEIIAKIEAHAAVVATTLGSAL